MIVTTKAVKQNKTNAKDWPAEYTCNFLTPGLVSYEDVGAGIANLPKETIMKMLNTWVGKPVVINHVDVTPKDFEDHAVGYVTKVWYDDYANWACCSFLLTDDKAKEAVAKGYSVSCAYDDVVTGPGGEKNAIKYDETIIDGVGNHLALVTTPRYEEAKIQPCMMLVNSKKATVKSVGNSVVVTVKVPETKRICDSCEYLVQGKCMVAGPGGKITQRYADLRLHGTEMECSAYEKTEGRKNKMIVEIKNGKLKLVENEKYIVEVTKSGKVLKSFNSESQAEKYKEQLVDSGKYKDSELIVDSSDVDE